MKHPKIYRTQHTSYVRISEVDPSLQERLKDFMVGQTCPIIDGIPLGDAIYPGDYQNFITKLTTGKEAFWD